MSSLRLGRQVKAEAVTFKPGAGRSRLLRLGRPSLRLGRSSLRLVRSRLRLGRSSLRWEAQEICRLWHANGQEKANMGTDADYQIELFFRVVRGALEVS